MAYKCCVPSAGFAGEKAGEIRMVARKELEHVDTKIVGHFGSDSHFLVVRANNIKQ